MDSVIIFLIWSGSVGDGILDPTIFSAALIESKVSKTVSYSGEYWIGLFLLYFSSNAASGLRSSILIGAGPRDPWIGSDSVYYSDSVCAYEIIVTPTTGYIGLATGAFSNPALEAV